MENKSFWKTKEGTLTIGFILSMVSFIIILIGIKANSELIENLGLLIVIISVLVSPIKVFILNKRKK